MKLVAITFLFSCAAVAATPASSREVLTLAGRALQGLWDQLSNVNCVETVQQVKLGPNGKPVFQQAASFDYEINLQLSGNDILVEESRMPITKAAEHNATPLLLTNGFSTLAFIFHPAFQNAFEYSAPVPVVVDGSPLLEVRFRHLPGARSPSVLKLKSREYPIDWQGTAWIEPATGSIVRISASLMPGLEDLGLKTLSADVRCSRVQFKDPSGSWWLPEMATIEVETTRQHWRNVHRFEKYRIFSVDTITKVEAGK